MGKAILILAALIFLASCTTTRVVYAVPIPVVLESKIKVDRVNRDGFWEEHTIVRWIDQDKLEYEEEFPFWPFGLEVGARGTIHVVTDKRYVSNYSYHSH